MKKQFRKGVASFYIVTFSTLILAVLAASFATIIVSELSRTSNEDLSQSAYDAALAGIEDAKVAYSNYLRCVNAGASETSIVVGNSSISCGEIIYWMNHPDCDMVGHILGRIGKSETPEAGVSIRDTESSDGDPINEAYTCAKISLSNSDYRSTLSSTEQIEVVKIQFEHPENIGKVKLSWYTNRADINYTFSNFVNAASGWRAAFQPTTNAPVATPPTVEFQLVQTATTFTADQLMQATTADGRTDRATLYLVPADESQPGVGSALTSGSSNNTYTSAYNGSKNSITSTQVAKTNDREISNKPFAVACNSSDAFACSVEIELPEPIGGDRSNETFLFMLSAPYGEPDFDFALEFYCKDGGVCETAAGGGAGGAMGETPITLHNAQVTIDSTGRANDLYRRIETRLITSDTAFAYPYYAIQILGSDSSAALVKNMTVKCEYGLYDGTVNFTRSPGCE